MLEQKEYDYSWLPNGYHLNVAEGRHGYMMATMTDNSGKMRHVEFIEHDSDVIDKYQPLTVSSVIEAFNKLRDAFESSAASGIFSASYFVGSYPEKSRTKILSK